MVWVLQPPLKVGVAHGGMEAAEPCGQRARRPAVYLSVSLLYRRWLPWGKALGQQQVKNCRHSGFVQPICWDHGSGLCPDEGWARLSLGLTALGYPIFRRTPGGQALQAQGLQQEAPRPSLLM